jgi:hypothetical protein
MDIVPQEIRRTARLYKLLVMVIHTFGELYEFRKVYNMLFNEWALQEKYNVYYDQEEHHDNKHRLDNENYFIV